MIETKNHNGQFDTDVALENLAKGVVAPVTSMLQSPAAFCSGLAVIGGSIAALSALPELGVVAVAGGLAYGAYKGGEFTYHVATAKTGDDVERAFVGLGEGVTATTVSLLGASSAVAAVAKSTDEISAVGAAAQAVKLVPSAVSDAITSLRNGTAAENLTNQVASVIKRVGWRSTETPDLPLLSSQHIFAELDEVGALLRARGSADAILSRLEVGQNVQVGAGLSVRIDEEGAALVNQLWSGRGGIPAAEIKGHFTKLLDQSAAIDYYAAHAISPESGQHVVNLSTLISDRSGNCSTTSIITQLLNQALGRNSYLVQGFLTVPKEMGAVPHAWNLVESHGEVRLLDVINGIHSLVQGIQRSDDGYYSLVHFPLNRNQQHAGIGYELN
jgi:hypothetical protein